MKITYLEIYVLAALLYFSAWALLIFVGEVFIMNFPLGLALVTYLGMISVFPLAIVFWGPLGIIEIIILLRNRLRNK